MDESMSTLCFFPPSHHLGPLSQKAFSPPPTAIPNLVYRVHRASAQARYDFSRGFFSKNQTTVLNYTSALSRFGLAHLHHQTNISSPFISVYDSLQRAEAVARYFASRYHEDVWVVTVDTRHLARGPVFRAEDLLSGAKGIHGALQGKKEDAWLHEGEYLLMYKIPAQAIRDQTPMVKVGEKQWRAPGVIGDR